MLIKVMYKGQKWKEIYTSHSFLLHEEPDAVTEPES